MMKTNIFIPKKIKVGFQTRSDTYTKKLAYVIYYDQKNKLRKETSWENWRDQKIDPEEYDNEPTAGFVLNKKVGGYQYHYDMRQTYVRVFDPRGFEFEITIPNLLYILENTSSIKGKGLEGEFVYGWDGKELILIPVESPDYKQISELNDIIHNNKTVKAKDLIVGATYLTKDNQEKIYMGKFDYYSYGYRWLDNGEYKSSKNRNDIPVDKKDYRTVTREHECIDYLYGKYFWFASKYYDTEWIDGQYVTQDTYTWHFEQYKSMSGNKFISCINDKCTENYAEIYEAMEHTSSFSPRDFDNLKYVPYTFEEFKEYAEKQKERYDKTLYRCNTAFFSDGHYKYELTYNEKTDLWSVRQYYYSGEKDDNDFYTRFEFENVEVKGTYSWYKTVQKQIIPMTIKKLYEKLKPCYKEIYLKNGNLYGRECYYGN